MNFLRPIDKVNCFEMITGVIASDEVKTGKLKGRHGIMVVATSDCVVGDEQVLTKKTLGIPLAQGEKMFFPVEPSRYDQLYLNGAADITEFF